MLPTARWAVRLSRNSYPARRSITTKQSGIPSKIPKRNGLPSGYSHSKRNSAPHPAVDAAHKQEPERQTEKSKLEVVQDALQDAASHGENSLLTPVHVPEDPNSVLKENHPALKILANSSIVVQRQIEMMNLIVGFEQANKYIIMDGAGNHIGYIVEPDAGAIKRQMFKTHRAFTAHVLDRDEKEVLRIHRPFTFINSKIGVYDAVHRDGNVMSEAQVDDLKRRHMGEQGVALSVGNISPQMSHLPLESMRIIGEVQQQWAPLRRKYDLFLNRPDEYGETLGQIQQISSGQSSQSKSTALQTVDQRQVNMVQWAYCNEPFLSWDFSVKDKDENLLGSVNRNFAGFGRELFTDTGVYALRMDAASLASVPEHVTAQGHEVLRAQGWSSGMTLDQRAVMLATAVSIDFDYFSRHSGSHVGGMWPMWMPWGFGGGAAGEAGAGAGAAGAAGAAGEVGAAEGVGTAVGAAARGADVGEGAIAGAGTMAGYEAMRRGMDGGGAVDDASPTAHEPWADQGPVDPNSQQDQSVWGEQDPWGGGGQGGSPPGGSGPDVGGGGGGGGGGDGGGFDWGDFF